MPGPLDRGWGVVVVVASGPSFSVEQAELIAAARADDRCRVIVVNDCYRRLPNADALYAADRSWWRLHIDAVRAGFTGECWTQDERAAAEFGLQRVEMIRGNGLLPIADSRITCGSNSGFQALMLARLFGARRIVLVGFDMQRTAGLKHWFGDHPKTLSNGDPRSFITHFDVVAQALAAESTHVVNCSEATALRCFARADLAATLKQLMEFA